MSAANNERALYTQGRPDKLAFRHEINGELAVHCVKCATDNPPRSKLCTKCGIALDIVCTACGRGCQEGARFCSWCGAPRTVPLAAAGERKQATVLFADIVASTEMIAGLDAEDAADRLRPAVEDMAKAVWRFDGTILALLGDGVNAIFGRPALRKDMP